MVLHELQRRLFFSFFFYVRLCAQPRTTAAAAANFAPIDYQMSTQLNKVCGAEGADWLLTELTGRTFPLLFTLMFAFELKTFVTQNV